MAVKNANDARTHWAEILDQVRDEPVHIERRGREVAVVVSPAFFARAVAALEDIEDVAAAETALEDEELVSHEQLMRDLGLETV
jgi:antitoxin StbD